jgi:hypothetical protein
MCKPIGKIFVYCGIIAVDLDPLPVSRARLTVVQPALFEWDVFEMAVPIQSPAKCSTLRVASHHSQSVKDCDRKIRVQKIVRTLGAQNVNGRSQNETDGFRAEVSHVLHTGRSF